MTITAKIIADSLSSDDVRITTLQLRYPRFIHAEFMTHRVFSRNASSSRAIPVNRLIDDVVEDRVDPSFWGANKKGMQATEEVADPQWCQNLWDVARDAAVTCAVNLKNAGAHKQIVNRILEPFSHINVVVTATEWDNFFALRCHPDAQPEMQELANAMRNAMEASKPACRDEHMPYISDFEMETGTMRDLMKISAARCARVSYLTHDGKTPTYAEDIKLYDRLATAEPAHLSPLEHPALAAVGDCTYANFRGWQSLRYDWERTSTK